MTADERLAHESAARRWHDRSRTQTSFPHHAWSASVARSAKARLRLEGFGAEGDSCPACAPSNTGTINEEAYIRSILTVVNQDMRHSVRLDIEKLLAARSAIGTTRYSIVLRPSKNGPLMATADMRPDPNGEWVRYKD